MYSFSEQLKCQACTSKCEVIKTAFENTSLEFVSLSSCESLSTWCKIFHPYESLPSPHVLQLRLPPASLHVQDLYIQLCSIKAATFHILAPYESQHWQRKGLRVMTSLHVASSQSAPAAHTDAITSRMTHFSCGVNLPRIDLFHRSVGLFGCLGINRVACTCSVLYRRMKPSSFRVSVHSKQRKREL